MTKFSASLNCPIANTEKAGKKVVDDAMDAVQYTPIALSGVCGINNVGMLLLLRNAMLQVECLIFDARGKDLQILLAIHNALKKLGMLPSLVDVLQTSSPWVGSCFSPVHLFSRLESRNVHPVFSVSQST